MKNLKKTLSAVLAAAVIFGTAAMPAYADRLKTENGILYRYNDDSVQIGKYTGWAKYKDGTRKYFLDGYFVKGKMPVGKNICTFDENGVLTEKKPAQITVTADAPVHSGDKVIPMTIKLWGKGCYDMVPSSKFERWEKGEWVDCLGEDVEFVTCDCLYTLDTAGFFDGSFDDEEKTDFAPEEYMGAELTAGYYRLTFGADGIGSDGLTVYAIIKVTD